MIAFPQSRHASDVTVELLDTDTLPAHASFNNTSLTAEHVGQLVVNTDEYSQVVPIKSNSVLTIGRSCHCSNRISHPTVSRRHLIVYSVMVPPDSSNSLVFCEDTNSLNGSFLQSCRLRSNEAVLLNHGDCIKIRHAASIFFLQANVTKADVKSIIGEDFNRVELCNSFRIQDRLIGKGGQAKIFLAQNYKTRQQVACKVIRLLPSTPDSFKYTRNEIEVLANISHPNIIPILSALQTSSSMIIFFPLFCGGDLHNFIFEKYKTGLDERNSRFIIYQILKAIEYLHSHGIAHRDLKLENILLHRPTTPAVITITDFGLARREPPRPGRMNSFCGTIDFMAPEMIKRYNKDSNTQGYGKEVDIWAIGIMLYIIMSGEFPFVDNTDEDVMDRIVRDGIYFNNEWKKKADLAKVFLRRLLKKDACTRPTATQALSHPFIARHTPELTKLHDEMTISSWSGRDTSGTAVLHDLESEVDVLWNDTIDTPVLTETDGNATEMKERKRVFVEGKENNSRLTEQNAHERKKRRIVQECFVLC